MVFGAVFATNFYNGLNTSAWTAWVFFCVFIGDLLVWVYTVSICWPSDIDKSHIFWRIGYLQCHHTSINPHARLWKQSLYVPVRILLVRFPPGCYPRPRATLSLQIVPNGIFPK